MKNLIEIKDTLLPCRYSNELRPRIRVACIHHDGALKVTARVSAIGWRPGSDINTLGIR